MRDQAPAPTLADRLALGVLGALTGVLYGILLALLVFWLSEAGHPELIAWSAAVFALMGFAWGNFVVEAFLALLHFIWGFAHAFSDDAGGMYRGAGEGHLRHIMLLGFGTGVVLLLWWYIPL